MSRVAKFLNRRVEVWRAVLVDDGGGGQSETRVLQGVLRARLSQPTARERTAAQQAGSDLSHTLYFAPSADVRRDDWVKYGGVIYDVFATFQPSVSDTYLRVDCTARQPTNGS